MMKPSTRRAAGAAAPTASAKSQTPPRRLPQDGKRRAGGRRQVPALYLAAAAGLALVGAIALAAGERLKSAQVSQAGRAPDANQKSGGQPAADFRLALPSSTTSALARIPASPQQARAATDLSVGQSNIANAKVSMGAQDMATAAGHHHGKSHGKYYMFAEVPKKGAYKMGFRRGNHKHTIERKESVHKGHVHSYFKWHDKKGKGSHKFEFKHKDKKGKHHY